MSIAEHYLIDGFDSSNKEVLIVFINDSLIWNEENTETHLFHLKHKISHYIEYLNGRKFDSMFKENNFSKFIINLNSSYKLPKIALDYLNSIEEELLSNNIELNVVIKETKDSC